MTSRVRTIAAALTLAVITCFTCFSGRMLAQSKTDITGTWAFEVTTDAGSGTSTVTFKQDGERLTGHYSGSTLGEAELTGTIKGQAVAFSFTANVQGNALDVSYSATADPRDAPTTMKGSLTITAIGNGTFTGKKVK